jgi:hypothetical protein
MPFSFAVMAWWRGWQAGVASAVVVAMLIALTSWIVCRTPHER